MFFSILLASSKRPFMVSVDAVTSSCVSSLTDCSSFLGLSSFLAALVIGRDDHPFPSPPLAVLSPVASLGLLQAGAKCCVEPQFQHRFLSSRVCCHAHSLPFLHPSSEMKNLQGALSPFPDLPSPFPSSIFLIFTSGCAVFCVSLLVLFLLPSRCAICSISAKRCVANFPTVSLVGVESTCKVDRAKLTRKFSSLFASRGFFTILPRPLRSRNGSGSLTCSSMALLRHLIHFRSALTASATVAASAGISNDRRITSFSASPPG